MRTYVVKSVRGWRICVGLVHFFWVVIPAGSLSALFVGELANSNTASASVHREGRVSSR